ncbi:hypothetical protein BD770DRAFT_334949 [Pilaira anomala]|nr:hypothetical protein BD770DRAFT_334949 [Pilaira anomala]
MIYGVRAKFPLLPNLTEPSAYNTEGWIAYLNNHLPVIHGVAIENIKKTQVKLKRAYNKGPGVKYDYQPGNLVTRKNLIKNGFPNLRWLGPYKVLGLNNKEGTSFKILLEGIPDHYQAMANARILRPWFSQDYREEALN